MTVRFTIIINIDKHAWLTRAVILDAQFLGSMVQTGGNSNL
jgi:hypothetical protein